MRPQQDDHCVLNFRSHERRIEYMATMRYVLTRSLAGPALLDLSRVDWDAYLAAWERMQDERFPGWR